MSSSVGIDLVGLMARDFAALVFAGGLFLAFAAGTCASLERLWSPWKSLPGRLWIAGSLGAYALIMIAWLLELLHVAALPALGVVIILLQGTGLWHLGKTARTKPKLGLADWWLPSALLLAAAALWTAYQADLPGLSSQHDGITHLAFVLRMLESGHLLLTKVSPGFSDIWSNGEHLTYYPCGSHALAAAFLWPWVKITGVLSVATGVKAIAALMPALVGPMALALLGHGQRAAASRPARLSLLLLVGILACTDPRVPVWMVDSGGFSRLIGYFLALPLIWGLLAAADAPKANARLPLCLALVLALIVPTAFIVHPTSSGILGLAVAGLLLLQLGERRIKVSLRLVLGLGAALLCAIGLVYAQLQLTDSIGYANHSVATDGQIAFSWKELRGRVLSLYKVMFFEPSAARLGPLALSDLLCLLGLVAYGWRRQLGLSTTRTLFPWVAFAGLSVVVATGFVAWMPVRAIGEVFYHNRERITEAYFLAKPLLWLNGLSLAALLLRQVTRRYPRLSRPTMASLLTVLFAGLFTADKLYTIAAIDTHLNTHFSKYQTPRYSDSEDLARFVRTETASDAVFLYQPYLMDSLESRTGRRGFFMFQECPELNDTASCRTRLAISRQLHATFASTSEDVSPGPRPCTAEINGLQELKRRNLPTYLIVKQQSLSALTGTCSDLRPVYSDTRYAVVRLLL